MLCAESGDCWTGEWCARPVSTLSRRDGFRRENEVSRSSSIVREGEGEGAGDPASDLSKGVNALLPWSGLELSPACAIKQSSQQGRPRKSTIGD